MPTGTELIALASLIILGSLFLWSIYEMWTLPPDAEEWDHYREAWEYHQREEPFRKP